MFKKLYLPFILSFFLLGNLPLTANEPSEIKPIVCSPKLKKPLNKITAIPEARNLIAKVQESGWFSVEVDDHPLANQFGAFWDMTNRRICVSLTPNVSEGEVIGSIIFELCNAEASARFDYLDEQASKRKIDKETYVKGVERIEYENSKKASAIAQKGIELGILPRNARLGTYSSFEEHYRYQKIGGHSDVIAKNFDRLNRYPEWTEFRPRHRLASQ